MKMSDLRYTTLCKRKGGKKTWKFVPPDDVLEAGVVGRESFKDGRVARTMIPKYLDRIDAFRAGQVVPQVLFKSSTLAQAIAHYKGTKLFNNLSLGSQEKYTYSFNSIVGTPYRSGIFGSVKVEDLTANICTQIYEVWVAGGVSHANNSARVFSVIMSYCISRDMIPASPMTKVRKVREKVRSVVWNETQVSSFLDVAFSDFEYRSIGLLVYMAYDWCQRPIDIRLLKWNCIDFSAGTVKIVQRKRGATVCLPIALSLLKMLKDQQVDYGFQDYVIPVYCRSDNAYRPLTRSQVSMLIRNVKNIAGLPDELKAGDLRKTGLMEMVEAGVDSTAIMSVSGHKSLASLTPYKKHTLKAATAALEKRNGQQTLHNQGTARVW